MGGTSTKLKKLREVSNIDSPIFENRLGLSNKKIIHRMVFVRHGETESNKHLMNGKTSIIDPKIKNLNTPLSKIGVKQSQNVATYLKLINFIPDEIIVSSLDRAIDTGKPYIIEHSNIPLIYDETIIEYNHKHDETVETQAGTWLYKEETLQSFIQRIVQAFKRIKNKGSAKSPKQTLIYTHSQVISAILTNGIYETENITNAFFHLSNCSITCIDMDEDNKLHIQAVNYTKHLDTITGNHSPFI